jgi:hypothetical protein
MQNPIALIEAHQKRVDEKNGALELPPTGMSLDLLRMVYRNSSIPLSTRIRCAIAALPHEFPRLQVTAQIQDSDLATLLDERIKRMEQINNGGMIEAKPVPEIEMKPPKPHINDRRFRRI